MSDPDLDPTRVDVPRVDVTSVFTPDGGFDGGAVPPEEPWVPSEPPPPDRRPWIIAGLLALIVVILVLVLLLRDDNKTTGSSSTTTSEVSTSTSASTTTSAAPTTTSTAAPTSTTSPVVTVPPATCADAGTNPAKPGLVAQTVYDAWVRSDDACAATLMTPAARNELFSRDGTGAKDQFQGCTQEALPDPHADCAFTYEGGATHYLMTYSATDGWKVVDITQVAD
jgi:cytoskeletal protein RodZ